MEILSGIDPLDPAAPMADQLQIWNDDALIVGHQPFMGELAARLVTGAEEPGIVVFEPGTMISIERASDGHRAVTGMLRPRLPVHRE